MEKTYDYIVIGSGFGGSVSAMRLAEKGYSVLVIEKGRRWKDSDFPKNNWNVKKYLWFPMFNWLGFQKIDFFKEVMILSGAGVGGGSLVYANTHMYPPDAFFENPAWAHLKNWKSELKPFYETAKFMLGTTQYNKTNIEDDVLEEIAREMGREDTYGRVDGVGVYLGKPDVATDPYFNGLGPERKGCIECAGCMVGCRHNAKNTLEKNYLWFAEQFGAQILPQTEVGKIEFINNTYHIHTQRTGAWLNKNKQILKAKGIVVSAGVLGTLHLLLRQKYHFKTLPNLSAKLGENLRTNSEMLCGITAADKKLNNGLAISSVFNPDEHTHIELCKYPNHSGLMTLLGAPATGEAPVPVRALKMVWNVLKSPLQAARLYFQKDHAKNSIFLLVMQSYDNAMKMVWSKNKLLKSGKMTMQNNSTQSVPAFIGIGQEVLYRYAKKVNGVPVNAATEIFFNMSSTAHILGGCPMGKTTEEGVVNENFAVHGYPNMYIADGSMVQGNLGVNPSLTITALSEYAMAQIAAKPNSTQKTLAQLLAAQKEVGKSL